MIIHINTSDGSPWPASAFEVEAVPRIGEAVDLSGHLMRVKDVVHELAGRGTRIIVSVR
jgi:hypothetical protein